MKLSKEQKEQILPVLYEFRDELKLIQWRLELQLALKKFRSTTPGTPEYEAAGDELTRVAFREDIGLD